MKDLIFQEKFPGFEQILDFLPHLGEMYEYYLGFHSRVLLEPLITFKGKPHRDRVRLSVKRYRATPFDSKILFRAEKSHLEFNVLTGGIRYENFDVAANLKFPEIAGKFSAWLESEASKVLNQFEFHLALSEESKLYLTESKELAISTFISSDLNVNCETLRFLKFHIVVKGPSCPGLILPGEDNYLQTDWASIFPNLNENRILISVIARWYYRWLIVKKLFAVDKDCIDLEKLWKSYQDDMRYRVEMLNLE